VLSFYVQNDFFGVMVGNENVQDAVIFQEHKEIIKSHLALVGA